MHEKKKEIMKILSAKLRKILENSDIDFERLQELRLRMNEPFIIRYDGKEYFVAENGSLTKEYEDAYEINAADIKETLEYISSFCL